MFHSRKICHGHWLQVMNISSTQADWRFPVEQQDRLSTIQLVCLTLEVLEVRQYQCQICYTWVVGTWQRQVENVPHFLFMSSHFFKCYGDKKVQDENKLPGLNRVLCKWKVDHRRMERVHIDSDPGKIIGGRSTSMHGNGRKCRRTLEETAHDSMKPSKRLD